MDRNFLNSIIDRYEAASFIVYRRMNAAIREGLSDDLTIDQAAMIRYIRKRGRSTATELAETFCVGKSSITAITSRLFDKNFIRRIPDETDRRVTYFVLTEEGQRKSEEMDEKIQEILMEYIGHFSVEEAVRFIETFEKLAKVLKGSSESS